MKTTIALISALFVYNIGLSQITGTVKNQASEPIENALVCLSNDSSVWTKTDEDGNFSLPTGNSNTALRIGALHYETIKSQSIGSGTITMQQDQLEANGDVYHISFDHLRPGNSYSNAELREDFPVTYSKGLYDDGDPNSDRTAIDYNESIDAGGVSLRATYTKNGVKTNDSGVDLRIPLGESFKDNFYQSRNLYLSYWLKFSDDFDFDLCGGKLPSLGGSNINTPDMPREDRDQNRWKGRIMFRKGGGIQFYMELPGNQDPENDTYGDAQINDLRFWGDQVVEAPSGTSKVDICEFEYENYLRPKGWHNIELHYKFETPGQNDGIFEGWVDGSNYDFINSDFFNYYLSAGRENLTINNILISTFLGGTDLSDYGPTKDYYIWFDEFRVSETRINEYNNYTANTTLSNSSFDSVINTNNSIYPIPSKDGNFHLLKAADWEVYDLSGRKIHSGSGKTIQIQNYSKGIYFVRLDKSTLTKRIVLE